MIPERSRYTTANTVLGGSVIQERSRYTTVNTVLGGSRIQERSRSAKDILE